MAVVLAQNTFFSFIIRMSITYIVVKLGLILSHFQLMLFLSSIFHLSYNQTFGTDLESLIIIILVISLTAISGHFFKFKPKNAAEGKYVEFVEDVFEDELITINENTITTIVFQDGGFYKIE